MYPSKLPAYNTNSCREEEKKKQHFIIRFVKAPLTIQQFLVEKHQFLNIHVQNYQKRRC